MTARARWFLDEALAEGAEPQLPIEDVGAPIDLHGEPALSQRLLALVAAEQELYNRGVRCAIKEREDTTCHACPLRQASGSLAELCDVGLEQERVLTELAVVKHGPA